MSMAAFPDRPVRRPAVRVLRPARPFGRKKVAAAPSRASLVADFLAACELDPSIEGLRAPAEPATFDIDGTMVEHFADFELMRDGATTLVDVVTEADLVHHPFRAALVGGAVAVDGRAFAFETVASVMAEPRFTTVRLIMACRRTPVTAGDRVRILHQLDECGTMRLVDCAGTAQNAGDGVAAVLALAVEGLVAVDINRPILPETPVRRRKLAYSDPFEF
jgi:hypothetical protein